MIRNVLIDLSGTLYIENEVIPGAIEALKRLISHNIQIKFVTNTTKESQNCIYERMQNMGFPVEKKQIHTSLIAARNLIINDKLKPLLLVSPEAMEDFEGLNCPIGEKPNSVVIGLAPDQFYYDRLNEAFRYLLDGARLIAIHSGKYYKRKDGLALGPGCFVQGLEYAAQCKAEIVGKPNVTFFQSAINECANENHICPTTDYKSVVMIGDDVIDDVEGAMKAGMRGILVKTGKYRTGDENRIEPKPYFCASNFTQAVDKILDDNKC